jgi:hypothetical protein
MVSVFGLQIRKSNGEVARRCFLPTKLVSIPDTLNSSEFFMEKMASLFSLNESFNFGNTWVYTYYLAGHIDKYSCREFTHSELAVGIGRDLSARRLTDENGTINTEATASHTVQKIKSLSELIGAYKTITSKLIRAAGLSDFSYQRSFYGHIIRSDTAYKQIKDYILSNPEKWPEDVFYQQE